MTAHRLTVRILATLCVLVGLMALWGVPAQATVTHEYLSQFGEVPVEGPSHEPVALPGPVTSLESMTVDSGHVWIAEHMEGASRFRVDEFDGATGGFLAQPLHSASESSESPEYLGVAVGHLAGEPKPQLYIAEYDSKGLGPAVVGVYSTSGVRQGTWTGAETPAGPFGVIFSVVVDNSESLTDWAAGDVYVPVPGQNVVDVFKPVAGGAEKYVTRLTGTCATPASCTEDTFSAPRQVVVDSANGDVLVGDGNVVDVFVPTVLGEYAFVRQLTGTPAGPFNGISGMTVDSGSGDIYVAEGSTAVVDQFSSGGVYRGHLTGTPTGPFRGRLGSVAVDPASHDLYVGDSGFEFGELFSSVNVFGPSIRVPDVTTEPASAVKPRSAALNGTVNPDKAGAATCQFDYGTSKSFGQVAPCSKGVAEGESPVVVHAEANLQPDTTYFYRLQARNANGTNLGEPSQDQQFTTSGPGLHGEFASVVTSGSATLGATIDPHGAPTSYYFQYGAGTSYEASVPLAPGLGLGSGEGDLNVSIHVQGLAAGTTYHYRVVIAGEPGGEPITIEGEDQTFTTQAAGNQFGLPDGRAWEMVTPPNKQGAGLVSATNGGAGYVIQASDSGGAITYAADASFVVDPAGNHSPENSQVYSTRTAPGGWESQDITTPHNDGAVGPAPYSEYRLFSPDLSLGLVEPVGHTPLPPLPSGSEKTMYLRNANGEFEALVTAANIVPAGAKFGETGGGDVGGFKIAAATPDLSHVVLESSVELRPREAGLYEWGDGQLQFASVLPNGEPVKEALLGYEGGVVRRAISNDGSRVIWQSRSGKGGERLYLRDMTRGETVQVDAARGAPEAIAKSIYRTADSSGSRVFFTNSARLTADSRLVEGRGEDLYVFEVTSGQGEPLAGKLTDLTVDRNAGESADVRGVIEVSEDGSSVYFVANGVLGDGAEHGAKRGDCELEDPGSEELKAMQSNTCNLYVERYDAGSKAWTLTFITALSGADRRSWNGGGRLEVRDLTLMTSRVSPDGRYLAFMSDLSLTGYDNRDADSGMPDEEVFLYDASTGRVVCASCNPTGARPVGTFEGGQFEESLVGSSRIWKNRWLAGSIPGWASTTGNVGVSMYQPRYLSNSGRLFFSGADALVPADVNGSEDVYQYEPAGVGGCQAPGYGQSASVVFSESAGGCVGLISAGTSSEESAFMDASESGGDVFFMTLSPLSSLDYDTSMDVYDAHECTTGRPCAAPSPVASPPCVTGDACKAAPSPQPAIFGSPSSATFSGAGNITAPVSKPTSRSRKAVKCGRGMVKKQGRCVKKKVKRAKRPARRGK